MKTSILKIIIFAALRLLFAVYVFTLSSCALIFNDQNLDPLEHQTEDGLPILYLHPLPRVAEYAPTTLYYRGVEYRVQAKTRGESSLWYPQKSFTIMFPDNQLFSDSFYGFENKRKIILITGFDDNSYIRQRLAYDMWNRMSPSNIQVNTCSAVVYGNGKYHGLYTLCDRPDTWLMQENSLSADGNLYKTVTWDADFRVKKDKHAGFEKKEGYPEHGDAGAFADLDQLIEFADHSSAADFSAGFGSIAEAGEFMDCWILLTILYGCDSQVKNLYYYHDSGSPWKILPWDFNCSFGQDSRTVRLPYTMNDKFGANRIFERFAQIPALFEAMTGRLITRIDGGSLDLSWVLSMIDEYHDEIQAAALKNEHKWSKKYRNFWIWDDRNDFTGFEIEIEYIRQWISNRYDYLEGLYE